MNNTRFGCGELQYIAQASHDLAETKRLLRTAFDVLGFVERIIDSLEATHRWCTYTGFGVPSNEAGGVGLQ